MPSELLEPAVELLGVAVYGVVAAVLTVLGFLAEQAGIQDLQAGQSVIGAWEIAIGIVVLFAALNVAKDFVLPQLLRSTEE